MVFNMEENKKNLSFEDVYATINSFFGDRGLKNFIDSKISQYTSEKVYKKMEKLYEKFSEEEKRIADFLVYVVEGKRDVLVYTDDKTFEKIKYEDIYRSMVGKELKGKNSFVGKYVKIEKRFELLEKVLESISENQGIYKNLVKYIAPFIYEKIKKHSNFREDYETHINNKFKLRHLKYALMNVKLAHDEKKNNNYRISYLDIYTCMALGETLREESNVDVLNENEEGNANNKKYSSPQSILHTNTVTEEKDTFTLGNVSPEKENIEEQYIQNTSTQVAERATSKSREQEDNENKNSGIDKKTLLTGVGFATGAVGILGISWLSLIVASYLINSCSSKIDSQINREENRISQTVVDVVKNHEEKKINKANCLESMKEYVTEQGAKIVISKKENGFNVVYIDKVPERKGLIETDKDYFVKNELKKLSNEIYSHLTKKGCKISDFQIYKTENYVGWGAKFDKDDDGKEDGILWLASARVPYQEAVSTIDTVQEQKVKKEEINVEVEKQIHADKQQVRVKQSGLEKHSERKMTDKGIEEYSTHSPSFTSLNNISVSDKSVKRSLTLTQIIDNVDGKVDGKYFDLRHRCEDELNRCVVGVGGEGGLYFYDNENRDWAIPKSYRDALSENGFVVSENGIVRVFNEDTNEWKEIISYDLYYYPKNNGEIIRIEMFEEKTADFRGRLVF